MHPKDSDRVYRMVSLADLENVANKLIKHAGDEKIWLFYGEMGSGKTALIKALCKAIGVQDLVNSPTFSIVNEYLTDAGSNVYHFDFYRIKNEAEAYDIGTEDYFYSGRYCFIEWPEKIPSLIPSAHVHINIQEENTKHRTIAISVHVGEEKNRI